MGEVIAILPDHNRMDISFLCCGDISGADYYEGNDGNDDGIILFSAHHQCFVIKLCSSINPLPLCVIQPSPFPLTHTRGV